MINEPLVDAVTEFLEAAVHTVLKARGVYPPALFENRRLYGISLSACRHPDVRSYVGSVLANLKPLLRQDSLQELVVAFFEPGGGGLTSKVSFIIQGFDASAQPPDWSVLEPSFRSTLLKLHFCDNLLQPLPPGSTFELLAVANSRAGVNAQAFSEESLEAILPQQPASGLPVNTCLLPGVLSMQVVAEAGRADAAYTGADAAGQAGGAGGSAGSQQQQQQQHGS